MAKGAGALVLCTSRTSELLLALVLCESTAQECGINTQTAQQPVGGGRSVASSSTNPSRREQEWWTIDADQGVVESPEPARARIAVSRKLTDCADDYWHRARAGCRAFPPGMGACWCETRHSDPPGATVGGGARVHGRLRGCDLSRARHNILYVLTISTSHYKHARVLMCL